MSSSSSSTPSSSLRSLLLADESTQRGIHAAQHLRVQQRAHKDHGRAHPVPGSEGVLEVEDGEDEAEELPQGHHQSDRQRGALCSENEHAADAYISEKTELKSEKRLKHTHVLYT